MFHSGFFHILHFLTLTCVMTIAPTFILVRFEVLTATSMKMAVFWVFAPCSLVEIFRLFRGTCCLRHQF
jgi:hypothetical protein